MPKQIFVECSVLSRCADLVPDACQSIWEFYEVSSKLILIPIRAAQHTFRMLFSCVALSGLSDVLRHWQLSYMTTAPEQSQTKQAYIKHPSCLGSILELTQQLA